MKLQSLPARARINFTLTLDYTRKTPNNRAYIEEKQRTVTRSTNLNLEKQQCISVNFFVDVSC